MVHIEKEVMGPVSRNVRFLLWKEDQDAAAWPKLLSRKLKTPWRDERVLHLLRGDCPEEKEIQDLVEAFNEDEAMLRSADFVNDSGTNILSENLKYLLGSLEHGGKMKLATFLGKHKTTLWRWEAEGKEPSRTTLLSIASFFGLSRDVDLKITPVFLSFDPLAAAARRAWLKERIDGLSDTELHGFFPALKKILE